MIAVICGTTGLTGSLLLLKLLSDNTITQVISITRKKLNQNHPKLREVLIDDFSKISQFKDELKGDIYFCCLGTTIKVAKTKENFKKVDFVAAYDFSKIAEAHQAKSLTVISAMGANLDSKIFYNQVKGELEQALLKLKINRLIIFRPALLIGNRSTVRPTEKMAINIIQTLGKILPDFIQHRMATSIEILTSRMLQEGKNTTAIIKIINAIDI